MTRCVDIRRWLRAHRLPRKLSPRISTYTTDAVVVSRGLLPQSRDLLRRPPPQAATEVRSYAAYHCARHRPQWHDTSRPAHHADPSGQSVSFAKESQMRVVDAGETERALPFATLIPAL